MKVSAVVWGGFCILLAVAGYFAPLNLQQFGLYCGAEGGALLVTILTSVRLKSHRWWVLALLLFFLGDMTYVYFDLISHDPRSFPNFGDIFYLGFYPIAAYALWKILPPVRQSATLADSALLAVGLAVPWWIFVEYPVLSAPGSDLIGRLTSVAYPLGDILLVALALRLLFWKVPKSVYYLAAAFLVLAFTDSIYSIRQLDGTFQHGSWLDYGWLLFYALWGLSFLLTPVPSELEFQPRNLSSSTIVLLASGAIGVPMLSVLTEVALGNTPLGKTLGTIAIVGLLVLVVGVRIKRLMDQPIELPDRERAVESDARIAVLEGDIQKLLSGFDEPPEDQVK